MTVRTQRCTLAEFEQIAADPDNIETRFEYVDGHLVETRATFEEVVVGAALLSQLLEFVEDRELGCVTGPDQGFCIGDERYVPSGAFVPGDCKSPLERFAPQPPALVIEVAGNRHGARLHHKLAAYRALGIVVWLVDAGAAKVTVHVPGAPSIEIDLDGTLTGGEVLPGFELDVSEIFPEG